MGGHLPPCNVLEGESNHKKQHYYDKSLYFKFVLNLRIILFFQNTAGRVKNDHSVCDVRDSEPRFTKFGTKNQIDPRSSNLKSKIRNFVNDCSKIAD